MGSIMRGLMQRLVSSVLVTLHSFDFKTVKCSHYFPSILAILRLADGHLLSQERL